MQEVGANHGVCTWGRSDSGLAAVPGLEHLVFVATRMQIHMEAYPKWWVACLVCPKLVAMGDTGRVWLSARMRAGVAAAVLSARWRTPNA